MHHVTQMLEAHPQATANEALTRCIEECFAYALTCTSCADACLAGEDVQELVRCIRLNLDCADVCDATGRVLTRQTTAEARLARSMLEACRVCAEECERHAQHHDHCRVCAEACRRCEQACEELRSSIAA
jgi:Domain of Unknown Function (DUF326)